MRASTASNSLTQTFNRLSAGGLDAASFGGVNVPIFEEAAVALYLVGEAATGDLPPFAELLQIGAIGQVLSVTGLQEGIGVCAVGGVTEVALQRSLGLADTTRSMVVHTLLAGAIGSEQDDDMVAGRGQPQARVQFFGRPRMADR